MKYYIFIYFIKLLRWFSILLTIWIFNIKLSEIAHFITFIYIYSYALLENVTQINILCKISFFPKCILLAVSFVFPLINTPTIFYIFFYTGVLRGFADQIILFSISPYFSLGYFSLESLKERSVIFEVSILLWSYVPPGRLFILNDIWT